ncbi:MAG: hypothetical protein EBS50_12260 [Sphingomonadaceae bacterium]|nr:hypothetical protein [Sphingomonadaceae bacterium]
MTKEQSRRVLEAIADCDRYIAKESPRDESLRPADVQKILQQTIAHREKLIEMLGAAEQIQVQEVAA